MNWTSNKRTGEIHNQRGTLITKVEFGQRQHTELLGQAQEMRKLLGKCLQMDLPETLDAEIRMMIFRTR